MNSRDFIKLLDDYEINIFNEWTIEHLTGYTHRDWKQYIRSLINNGMIVILEKGKYIRHHFSDEKVIGSFMSNGGALSYWSALNYYGLTSQISNTVFIQSPHKKRDKAVLGVNYNFILVENQCFFGLTKEGIGNNTYYVTDIEKTIIDCLLKPNYGGEYPDLIHAIGNTPMDESKLIEYCQKIDNGALSKRLGYFLEISMKNDYVTFIDYALSNKTKGYNLLDPKGSKDGKYTTKWDLCINIDEQAILSMMNEKLY